ncbi:hypothetical protein HDU80_008448 [Chytriomyces hyalinus]|nr:hypothetical protein HDU80_008448 [Chytriomyces hyalinus]
MSGLVPDMFDWSQVLDHVSRLDPRFSSYTNYLFADASLGGITEYLLDHKLLILLGAVLIFAMHFLYSCVVYPLYLDPLLAIPGPKVDNPFNMLGNMRGIFDSEPMVMERQWVKQFGDVCRYHYLFNDQRVIVTSQTGIRHVFVTHLDHYEKKTASIKVLKTVLGDGIFVVNGEQHKRQRAILLPAFRVKTVNALVPVFIQSSHELRDSWINRLHTSSEKRIDIDTNEELSKPTLDVIGRAGFGYEFNAVANGESPLYTSLTTIMGMFEEVFVFRDVAFPWLKWVYPPEWRRHARINAAKAQFRDTCMKMVELKRAAISEGAEESKDLLSALVRANIDEADPAKRLSDDELAAQVLTMVVAGHETSFTTLTWTLDFLVKDKRVQDTLRAELLKDMPSPSDDPSMELLQSNSNYLDAVVKESLRVVTPVPAASRKCVIDDVIDGYKIPKGTVVYLISDVIHKKEELWGPDALEFKPERWLQEGGALADSADAESGRAFGTYIPFLVGPRNCIGMKFAVLELKAILSVLVRNFEFSESLSELDLPPVKKTLKIVVKPDRPLKMSHAALQRVNTHSVLAAASAAIGLPLCLFIYRTLVHPFFINPLAKVPGPPVNPFTFLGNLPDILSQEPLVAYGKYVRLYGPIVRIRSTFNSVRVLVASSSGLRHVLGTHSHMYTKDSKITHEISRVLGKGLLTVETAGHKRQRAMINPVFRVQTINKLIPCFIQSGIETKAAWQTLFTTATKTIQLDISAELSKTTLDVIGRAGFGYEFNAVSRGESKLYTSFRTVLGLFDAKTFFKFYYLPFLRYFVPSERKAHREREDGKRVLKTACANIISQKLEQQQRTSANKETPQDLLSVLVEANQLADSSQRLSDAELMAQVNTFLLAGHETTGVALTWTLDFLAHHPRVQEKLRAEVMQDMPLRSSEPSADYIMSNASYLEAVMKESLRLRSPAPVTSRTALQDDIIDGFKIPKGTIVIISPEVMHKRAEFWGDDVLDFKPERWHNDHEQNDGNDGSSAMGGSGSKAFGVYMPFLLGPRNCIGSRFATLEFKTLLAILVRNFEFSPVPGFTYKKVLHVTLKPDPGLLLNVAECPN